MSIPNPVPPNSASTQVWCRFKSANARSCNSFLHEGWVNDRASASFFITHSVRPYLDNILQAMSYEWTLDSIQLFSWLSGHLVCSQFYDVQEQCYGGDDAAPAPLAIAIHHDFYKPWTRHSQRWFFSGLQMADVSENHITPNALLNWQPVANQLHAMGIAPAPVQRLIWWHRSAGITRSSTTPFIISHRLATIHRRRARPGKMTFPSYPHIP